MSSNQTSKTFSDTQIAFKEINKKLIDLSNSDLSKIHIGHEWSWIPYLKDHLDFLIEQVTGIDASLKDGPPPVVEEDIQHNTENMSAI